VPKSESKSELRQFIQNAVAALSPKERAQQNSQICDRAIEWVGKSRSFRVIGVFRALGAEADLAKFCAWALKKNFRLALPFVSPTEKGRMTFREFRSDTPLQKNRFGIEEPPPSAPELSAKEFDVIFVPGVAFTAEYQRLGRGAGFYDRFLAEYPDVIKIGVGFSCQLVDSLPKEAHDITLDGLLLPERFYYTS
jgi:5-formyltetrahydrofolate cyclo-ligase